VTGLAIGLLVLRLGFAGLLIGTMIVAASPAASNGLWAHLGGNEVPVVYAFLATVVAFTGPGRYSLDHALGLTALSGIGWSVAAVVVGVLAAVPMLLRRRSALRPNDKTTLHPTDNTALRRHDKEVTP
jgi:putative oxidoreductase